MWHKELAKILHPEKGPKLMMVFISVKEISIQLFIYLFMNLFIHSNTFANNFRSKVIGDTGVQFLGQCGGLS